MKDSGNAISCNYYLTLFAARPALTGLNSVNKVENRTEFSQNVINTEAIWNNFTILH